MDQIQFKHPRSFVNVYVTKSIDNVLEFIKKENALEPPKQQEECP